MSRLSWLVDPSRIATKIRSASGAVDPTEVQWKSNPSKCCPNCNYVMDNNDVSHAWPGLPRGVKFDPTDEEIVWHLLAKVGTRNFKPHPFIDEFIHTVDEEDGICYTHPQNLPGVNQDGSFSHFFHRAIKAYSTGTRKRRKINGDNSGDVRWHKTGRTKPVLLDGVQRGCKKIMVLYISPVKGGKSEKTNWVMHQYHLGTGEVEKEGEYVISKVFYQQQQQVKQMEKGEEEISEAIIHSDVVKVDPFTPKSVTPEPPRPERRFSNHEAVQDSTIPLATDQHHGNTMEEDIVDTLIEQINEEDYNVVEKQTDEELAEKSDEGEDDGENKWLEENESQIWLTSQQLVEGLSLCEEFLRSQSPGRDESGGSEQGQKGKALLSDYARLGAEDLKRDLEECRNMALDHTDVDLGTPPDLKRELEECQNVSLDPPNIDLDTPPDFRLSQLEFESEDSYIAWGGSIRGGKVID